MALDAWKSSALFHTERNLLKSMCRRVILVWSSRHAIHAPKMKYSLKHTHQYYTQVQHQMFVTGTSYADFVLYLPKESCIVRVGKDDSYHKVSVPLLEDFSNTILSLNFLVENAHKGNLQSNPG